jgi:hypothetical protein
VPVIDEFAKEYLHHDAAYWENHYAKIERAARAADPANA